MQTLPTLRAEALALAYVLAPVTHAAGTADLLTGTCAPNIHPVTLHALIRHESRVKQYAIGVNRKGQHLRQQPKTLAEATAAADRLIDQGMDFDA